MANEEERLDNMIVIGMFDEVTRTLTIPEVKELIILLIPWL